MIWDDKTTVLKEVKKEGHVLKYASKRLKEECRRVEKNAEELRKKEKSK